MKIIIAGSGKVGFTLAEQLVRESHDVTIVDLKEAALRRAADMLDIMAVQGNGVSANVLREAGADSADLVVATTNSDEVNMVCSLVAKNLGAKYTIARIRLLRFPSAANIESFCRGRVELMGFRLQEGDFLVGSSLRTLSSGVKRLSLLFCAVEREGTVLIPNGSFVPRVGDKLYLVGQPDSLDQFFRLLGRYAPKIRRVFLVGGGKISNYLMSLLENTGIQVKVVERREDRCRALQLQHPKATVLCGDGTDQELLESENLSACDAFVALTDQDEDNIIISLYARQMGLSKIIAKCNRLNYAGIVHSVGLESVLSPKFITASHMLRLVRGLTNSQGSVMNALYRIADGGAEAMEFTVSPNTRNLGVALKDLRLKPNILIAVLVRNQEIIIPEGSTFLQAGDRVIVISKDSGIRDLNDIYRDEVPVGGAQ